VVAALAVAAGLSLATVASAADTTPARRTLYLVRHGEYDHDDTRDEVAGHGLVPLGIAQATAVGDRLRGLPVRFSRVLASPLKRARETAEVIAAELGGLPLEIEPDLAECTPPTRRADIMAHEEAASLAACTAQLDRLAAKLFAPPTSDGAELVVAHGNVIRSLVVRSLAVDADAWLGMTVGNASLTTIAVDGRGARMILGVGDVGHLPPGLQSGLSGTPPRQLVLPSGKP